MRLLNPPLETEQIPEAAGSVSLLKLVAMFLKIGSIGFGGGMATIALMEEDFVKRRGLLPLKEFVHGVGLGHLLGGFAVNVAAFIGYRLFGMSGAFLSVTAFIAPSFLVIILLSQLYFRFHAVPALQYVMAGVSPVVIALIIYAAWSIGRRVLYSWPTRMIAAATLIASISGVNAAIVLVAAGTAGFLLPVVGTAQSSPEHQPAARPETSIGVLSVVSAMPTSFLTLFVTFCKLGLIFFGGGFVLIPILHTRLVTQLGWLTPHQFVDGLAISNLTPGPVALIVAFAGFHLAGVSGAFAATIGLFAPGILFTLAISHQYKRLLGDHRAQHFLAGVNPSVAGLIINAAFTLGPSALTSWRAYLSLSLSLAMLVGLRWHPVVILALGSAAGYLQLLP